MREGKAILQLWQKVFKKVKKKDKMSVHSLLNS